MTEIDKCQKTIASEPESIFWKICGGTLAVLLCVVKVLVPVFCIGGFILFLGKVFLSAATTGNIPADLIGTMKVFTFPISSLGWGLGLLYLWKQHDEKQRAKWKTISLALLLTVLMIGALMWCTKGVGAVYIDSESDYSQF